MKGEYLTVFCTSPDLKNARRVLDRLVKDRLVDRDLEGVRSLGAVLNDGNFVYSGKDAPKLGLYCFPAARD
jgi:hypothetical protein